MNTKIKKNTNKTEAVVNATKRSLIAENLINNTDCANNYDLLRFKVINNFENLIDLVRSEAISNILGKPELHKQSDYKVYLFV